MQNNLPSPHRAPVAFWLLAVYALVFVMVVVGGVTRLTGSGLSMVQWRPITGWLPPMGDQQWEQVFALYKVSPQYAQVNQWMSLSDFKGIFFWEYLHRVLGRVVFLVALVPWLLFYRRGAFGPQGVGIKGWHGALVWVGVAMQGVLGWAMVKSGLVNEPAVSHFRLAAHLSLAFLIGQWAWWLVLALLPRERIEVVSLKAAVGFLALLCLQVVYGAFMGGKRAGWLYDTFPDMAGRYAPQAFFGDEVVHDLLYGPAAIHWIHRTLAYAVVAAGLALALVAFKHSSHPLQRLVAIALLVLLGAQFVLGALTVVLHVPLAMAVAQVFLSARSQTLAQTVTAAS